MTDVQAFSVGRANNTVRDAVWKSDYDALAAEMASCNHDADMMSTRIREMEAVINRLLEGTHGWVAVNEAKALLAGSSVKTACECRPKAALHGAHYPGCPQSDPPGGKSYKFVERHGRQRRIRPDQDAYVSKCVHGILMECYCRSCTEQWGASAVTARETSP